MVTEEAQTIEYGLTAVHPHVGVTSTVDDDPLLAWLVGHALERGLAFSISNRWRTDKRLVDLPPGVVSAAWTTAYRESMVATVLGMLTYVVVDSDDSCRAFVYSSRYQPDRYQAVFDKLREWLEPLRHVDDGRVQIDFVYQSTHGPRSRGRRMEAPEWSAIRENYPAEVRINIDRLVHEFVPGIGGRLILLHGAPGTGKTYIIRTLAKAWMEWCEVKYVADPEAFFGQAEYMMKTLISDDDEDGKWRLLVVEDGGELLARDAKVREGQGLSRLLNLSEGLIGQGLKVLILISTNEDLKTLNEAVSRPGRTAAEIEFTPMNLDEANEWLRAHSRPELTVDGPTTLAELFALLSGVRITSQPKREPIGFLKG